MSTPWSDSRERRSDGSLRVHAFVSFATYGVPHIFPVLPGGRAVGMRTAHAAPPLSERLVFAEPYVWPLDSGVSGIGIAPLHPCVPGASAADPGLYQALALLDALRVGRSRERQMAVEALETLLAERDARWILARRPAEHAS